MSTQNAAGAWQVPFYTSLALLGLIGAWVQVIGMLPMGFIGTTIAFWKGTVTTPSSTFIVVDILVLAATLATWMFGECRRIGISAMWAWVYFLGSTFVAISCFFPLFMAHRARRLRAANENAAPQGGDWIAVVLAVAGALVGVAYSLTHIPA